MTGEARRAVIDDMIDHPDEYKRQCREQALRENPELTDEQFEADWKNVAQLLGL